MAARPSPPQTLSQEGQPPPGFMTLNEIRNLPSSKLKAKNSVNTIGLIRDYQAPFQTRGTNANWKCTIELTDHSIKDDPNQAGVKLHIFWDREKMPSISGSGDAILARNVKAQLWDGFPSLLASFGSSFQILTKTDIPKSIQASGVPWKATPPDAKKPGLAETAYAIRLTDLSDALPLPTTQEFEVRARQAMNVREKFCLLKDVKANTFHDVLGEVRRIYDTDGDWIQLYLSDYSANSLFYNHEWGEKQGENGASGRDGDDYGYLKSQTKLPKNWPGPFGKLTVQISVWDAHTEFVRGNVRENEWVLLRNVQFKIGKSGGLLEGFLRGDRNAFEGKVQVRIMQQAEEGEENDQRWKEGLKRKRDWCRKYEASKKAILAEHKVQAGEKRKLGSDESVIKNSKQRRKERRAAAEVKGAAAEAKTAAIATQPAGKTSDLNENVRCNHSNVAITPLSEILKPLYLRCKDLPDQTALSPFTVAKYRANVRIVDYFPHHIEDFAVGRRVTDFDILSDYSGGEDTDPEEDMRHFRSGRGYPQKKWEWRFAIKVEDAEAAQSIKKERLWLIVDNEAAQGLLNIAQDATNLRTDPDTLHELKEQLFKLWGDLEERKSALLPLTAKIAHRSARKSPSPGISDVITSSLPEINNAMPDPDSETEKEYSEEKFQRTRSVLKEKDTNASTGKPVSKMLGAEKTIEKICTEIPIKNKPFTCCIQQYGVKVEEDDPKKMNAGEGMRWVRRFQIFGTTIV